MSKQTTIMLATYNRLELTEKMIESLYRSTDSLFNLVIVDNGSTDGTVEWLNANIRKTDFCLDFQLIFNAENQGIAYARNQGLQASSKYDHEYLSTLDNDVELHQGWLRECIDIIEKNPKFVIGLNMEGQPYEVLNFNGVDFQFKRAGNLGTACTVFKKELHDKIGFFTTDFGLYGEEDADFFFRARRVGYGMGYVIKMGTHLGEGDFDTGPYREFKTKCHADNLQKFIQTCHEYCAGTRNIFVDFVAG